MGVLSPSEQEWQSTYPLIKAHVTHRSLVKNNNLISNYPCWNPPNKERLTWLKWNLNSYLHFPVCCGRIWRRQLLVWQCLWMYTHILKFIQRVHGISQVLSRLKHKVIRYDIIYYSNLYTWFEDDFRCIHDRDFRLCKWIFHTWYHMETYFKNVITRF